MAFTTNPLSSSKLDEHAIGPWHSTYYDCCAAPGGCGLCCRTSGFCGFCNVANELAKEELGVPWEISGATKNLVILRRSIAAKCACRLSVSAGPAPTSNATPSATAQTL